MTARDQQLLVAISSMMDKKFDAFSEVFDIRLKNELTSIRADIAILKKDVSELKEDAKRKDRQIAELNTKIDITRIELNSRIDRVHSELNSKIDKVYMELDGKISGLDAKIDKVYSELDGKITGLDAKIDKVHSELDGKISVLSSEVRDLRGIIENRVEKNIQLLSEGYTGSAKSFEVYRGYVDDLREDMSLVKEAISGNIGAFKQGAT